MKLKLIKNNLIPLFIFIFLIFFSKGDIAGLIGILTVTLIVIFLGTQHESVAQILYAALSVRIFLIYLDNNFITLPDSHGDAWYFELVAYEWSKFGILGSLLNFPELSESFLISYIISIFYSLLDRSILLAKSISLLFGILSVLMSIIIAEKIWDKKTSRKVGWFTAFYPSLILYSSLVMREMYICFFLLLAVYNIINWSRTGSIKSFFFVILSFIGGAIFHGGIYIGLIVFIIFVITTNLKKTYSKLINGKINLKVLIFFIIFIFSSIYLVSNNIAIPKIGNVTNIENLKKIILKKNLVSHRGNAKYPDWVVAESEKELIYKIPLRGIYLMFSPFPWEIKNARHFLGVFDGLIFILMVYCIFKNRKAIMSDPALKVILFILIAFVLVHGVATGNFGTALRHRTKFVAIFILLSAPLLPKFIVKKNEHR